MNYISTRDSKAEVSAAQAIAQGISKESGLFVPERMPRLSEERLRGMVNMTYIERARVVLGEFLPDFTAGELEQCVNSAYGGGRFRSKHVAPVVRLEDGTFMLELWHGPTCAFKDLALQLLPQLMTRAVKKSAEGRETAILTATSGDTGKAALEGFRDVPGTRILVFYPEEGVSRVQKLQMVTQEGENVGVCGVRGNFDDAQNGVKAIFTDPEISARLERANILFSSANSINWGRLAPQIVYYIGAYCDMARDGSILFGEKINIAVPTGNFGNILAAYYAKQMGLPVNKLICASNMNNVLTDFIRTGMYDRRRAFHMTASPSMDILISSNLERLLHTLYGYDGQAVSALMNRLAEQGYYAVTDGVRARLQEDFYGGFCDEETTLRTIRDTYNQMGYLCDPHTAVGVNIRYRYQEETGDRTKTLVASTAHPCKFAGSMLYALRGSRSDADEFEQLRQLSKITRIEIPPQILALQEKPERFTETCDTDGMADYVRKTLGV